MSVLKRMSDIVQEKLNSFAGKVEDPNQALDLAYQKQLEQLQQVRRSIADVLTAEKRLELQAAQLRQQVDKLKAQAQTALQQNREDLARLALTRADAAQQQLAGLEPQIQSMKEQEGKLEMMAQKLTAKVEAFRTQKETMKATYTAAQASSRIGEAVTGLSEQMADVSLMVDRAQEKTVQMQARASAIDQLVDTGVLDQIGVGGDDIDRQLAATTSGSAVDAQIAEMKARMLGPGTGQSGAPSALPAGSVVRIQGDDQYRLPEADRNQLDTYDKKLAAAIAAGDEPAFKGALAEMLQFVRTKGERLSADTITRSDVVVPSADMTLEDARKVMSQ